MRLRSQSAASRTQGAIAREGEDDVLCESVNRQGEYLQDGE